MLFNSLSFCIFFPVVVLAYFVIPYRLRQTWLLAASYFFYMSWSVRYGLLILTSTVITYFCALLVDRAEKTWMRRLALVFCLLSNLGILFFFKYCSWFLEEVNALLGTGMALPFSIVLPVGISFYTFQALGYVIDVYRRDIAAEKNFLTYALFVSFFPQLVAGPIERSKNLLHQLQKPTEFDPDQAVLGLRMMLVGYLEKIVIADNLAMYVDSAFGSWTECSGASLFVAANLHVMQVYCDFGGYSLIAIGAARVLNVKLMDNFEQPFFARTVREFWRRWHVSLSTWFKDYVYIPMGGSRCSKRRKYFNLMVTFTVSGLWHGASMHYVVWGAMNGLYQVVGEILLPVRRKIADGLHIDTGGRLQMLLQIFVTFELFVFSMIFFRATGVWEGVQITEKIFAGFWTGSGIAATYTASGLTLSHLLILLAAFAVMLAVDLIHEQGRHISPWLNGLRPGVRYLLYLALLLLLLIALLQNFGRPASAFLYFQF